MRTGSISLTIDSQFQHVFLVGIAVQRVCSWIPLNDQCAFEMETAVVEAVNNSIEHACHNQPGYPITTRMNLREDRITFVISDGGDAVTRLPEMPVLDDRQAGPPERGRGLQIMRAVMDEVAYCTDGIANSLTMVKYLPIASIDDV